MSRREAARLFGINRRTVEKMLMFSIPPGYRRDKEIRRPKLDDFIGIIDQILEADRLVPKKQRHTSKRVFERLRNEYDFTGGITIVKDYIFAARQRQREMFVPLSHPPGHAQADFGEACGFRKFPDTDFSNSRTRVSVIPGQSRGAFGPVGHRLRRRGILPVLNKTGREHAKTEASEAHNRARYTNYIATDA
jgi:hypothetical protein